MYIKKCIRCKTEFKCVGGCNLVEESHCLCTECLVVEYAKIARRNEDSIDYLASDLIGLEELCGTTKAKDILSKFLLSIL